jgi:hypothetical protein
MEAEKDSVHGSGWVSRPAIVYARAFAPDLNQDLLDSTARDNELVPATYLTRSMHNDVR